MENEPKLYTELEMLYASHVLQGKRTMEQIPPVIRATIQEIVDNAVSK